MIDHPDGRIVRINKAVFAPVGIARNRSGEMYLDSPVRLLKVVIAED
jgi:hypothetical protein